MRRFRQAGAESRGTYVTSRAPGRCFPLSDLEPRCRQMIKP